MSLPIDRTKPESSTHSQTWVVLLLAAFLRLLVLYVVAAKYPAGWLYTHGTEMTFLAKSLLAGHGLGSPFGVPTGPTAIFAPGYSLLVALVFRLFGSSSQASAVVIILCQIVLNLLTIWLMMHIARKLFGQRTALAGGLIWACSLPLLWLPTILWDTCISVCAIVGLMALALRSRQSPSWGWWLLPGAVSGIAALLNPALLLVLFAILGWAALQPPRHRKHFLLAVLAFLLVYSPWPIRNARVFHAFIPLRTAVGIDLWMGNRAGATGFLNESIFPTFNPQELSEYERMGEVAYTNHKIELAKEYILGHPGIFAKLTARRIVRFWLGTGTEGGSALFAIHASFTFAFGLAGLWLIFRRKRWSVGMFFLLPLMLFPLPYYITHAEFRYRVVIDPLLTILAAYALVELGRRLEGRGRPAEDSPAIRLEE